MDLDDIKVKLIFLLSAFKKDRNDNLCLPKNYLLHNADSFQREMLYLFYQDKEYKKIIDVFGVDFFIEYDSSLSCNIFRIQRSNFVERLNNPNPKKIQMFRDYVYEHGREIINNFEAEPKGGIYGFGPRGKYNFEMLELIYKMVNELDDFVIPKHFDEILGKENYISGFVQNPPILTYYKALGKEGLPKIMACIINAIEESKKENRIQKIDDEYLKFYLDDKVSTKDNKELSMRKSDVFARI